MRQRIRGAAAVLAIAFLMAGAAFAQLTAAWTAPFPPFRIAGNLYYVGSKSLASYLITTPQGNILISGPGDRPDAEYEQYGTMPCNYERNDRNKRLNGSPAAARMHVRTDLGQI